MQDQLQNSVYIWHLQGKMHTAVLYFLLGFEMEYSVFWDFYSSTFSYPPFSYHRKQNPTLKLDSSLPFTFNLFSLLLTCSIGTATWPLRIISSLLCYSIWKEPHFLLLRLYIQFHMSHVFSAYSPTYRLMKRLIEQSSHSPLLRYHIEVKSSLYFDLVANIWYCSSNTRIDGFEKQNVVGRVMVPNY